MWLECLKGLDNSEDLGIDERIILKRIFREIICEVVDWIHLAQDRDRGGL
jgi:hypothetical protein